MAMWPNEFKLALGGAKSEGGPGGPVFSGYTEDYQTTFEPSIGGSTLHTIETTWANFDLPTAGTLQFTEPFTIADGWTVPAGGASIFTHTFASSIPALKFETTDVADMVVADDTILPGLSIFGGDALFLDENERGTIVSQDDATNAFARQADMQAEIEAYSVAQRALGFAVGVRIDEGVDSDGFWIYSQDDNFSKRLKLIRREGSVDTILIQRVGLDILPVGTKYIVKAHLEGDNIWGWIETTGGVVVACVGGRFTGLTHTNGTCGLGRTVVDQGLISGGLQQTFANNLTVKDAV